MDKYQETKNRYLKEKVEELKIRVPKGEKAKIQAYAKSQGKSLNKFILDLISQAMGENSRISF
ncbi:MAG: toxin-antitoxin system HicB family antitoxin [Ruminococcus sp.]|nr:toxin-antitoxin system HicB family antitoxin [Ruminococcus sp.]